MDNLTHTLAGLMLARVGLEKTTPRGTAMLMLAANAPDLDAVVWFRGTLPYIEFHRTYTHSLVFLPLMALLPMLIVRAKWSWRSYLASIAGVLSHLLLDWTNAYGIPLLYPLSARRFSLDITNIFDLWIWGNPAGSRGGHCAGGSGERRDRGGEEYGSAPRLGLGSAGVAAGL